MVHVLRSSPARDEPCIRDHGLRIDPRASSSSSMTCPYRVNVKRASCPSWRATLMTLRPSCSGSGLFGSGLHSVWATRLSGRAWRRVCGRGRGCGGLVLVLLLGRGEEDDSFSGL